jgi:hypothetical protein
LFSPRGSDGFTTPRPAWAEPSAARAERPSPWEGKSKLPERGHLIEFHISTLGEPETFRPMNHVFYQEKLPWFDVADRLPRYVGLDFNSEICRYGPADGDLPNA